MKISRSQLQVTLQACIVELERLRAIHTPKFEGKVGEPDLIVINLAKIKLKDSYK